MPFKELL